MLKEPRSITAFVVAICTRNRAGHLRACLEGLAGQTDAPGGMDILVVDNGSTDCTAEVVAAFQERITLRYFQEPRTGLSYARNTALDAACAEWIVYLDDDAIPPPTWSQSVEQGIMKWNPDLFGGPFVPHFPARRPRWFEDRFGSALVGEPEGLIKYPTCFVGGNMGWRRSILLGCGGFDPNLGMIGREVRLGEETAVQLQLWRSKENLVRVMLPGMLISHFVSSEKMTLNYIAQRSFIYGRQMGAIDPHNEVWARASFLRSFWLMRGGVPLVLKSLWYALSRRRQWRAYAADWLSLHAIHLGAAVEKMALV